MGKDFPMLNYALSHEDLSTLNSLKCNCNCSCLYHL